MKDSANNYCRNLNTTRIQISQLSATKAQWNKKTVTRATSQINKESISCKNNQET